MLYEAGPMLDSLIKLIALLGMVVLFLFIAVGPVLVYAMAFVILACPSIVLAWWLIG